MFRRKATTSGNINARAGVQIPSKNPNRYHSGRPARRAGRSRAQASEKGAFLNNTWHCDCTPRLPAQHFRVKKPGPNLGRGFYTCQKTGKLTAWGRGRDGQPDEKTSVAAEEQGSKCGFFLWEEDAKQRVEAVVIAGMAGKSAPATGVTAVAPLESASGDAAVETTELQVPKTHSKRQLPWSTGTDSEHGEQASSKRRRGKTNANNNPTHENASSDEEFYDWPSSAAHARETCDALSEAAAKLEADAAVATTLGPTTPRKPQALPPPNKDSTSTSISKPTHGLPTPGTTPLKPQHHAPAPPGTPTPSRFHNAAASSPQPTTPSNAASLTSSVFALIAPSMHAIPASTQTELRSLLDKHERQSAGYARGRDATRAVASAREVRIAVLEGRVQELEGEVEGLRCVREMEMEMEAVKGGAK